MRRGRPDHVLDGESGHVDGTPTGDPVFAAEMVGPGVAIDPDPGPVTVVSTAPDGS